MPDKVRSSSLDEASDCARRHAAKQFGRELAAAGYEFRKTLNSIGSLVGRAVPNAVKLLLLAKRNGELLSLRDALNVSISEFDAELNDGAQLDATTPSIEVA